MSKCRKNRTLIIDANVLIDYADTDVSILELVAKYLGTIFVPLSILQEVRQLSREDCTAMGIQLIEPTTEQFLRAGEGWPGLSFEDAVCLVLAKDGDWSCVTNDGKFRKVCKDEGVAVMWGLELMIELVRIQQLSSEGAIQVAHAIKDKNPYITEDIVRQFEEKV